MRRDSAPVPWLLWALAALVGASLTRHPLHLTLLTCTVWAVSAAHGHRLPLRMTLLLVGFGALWNVASVRQGQTALFRLPETWLLLGGAYTLEALAYGALQGWAVAVIVAAAGLLTAELSPRDVARLAPPALYEVGLMLSVALAFLPQGRETLAEIRQAQAVRGHRVRGVRDLLPLLLPLLIAALERALALAEAMEARGFTAGREQASGGFRGLAVGALLCGLAGIGAQMAGLSPGWSGGLWAGGGALAWLALRRARPAQMRTVYRPRRLSPAVWGVSGGALLALAGWSALAAFAPDALAYTVYPRLSAPGFEAWAAIPSLLLALPAVISPVSRKSKIGNQKSERFSAVFPTIEKPPPEIVFAGVTFTYPGAVALALRDLRLTIPPGVFVVVTGPSGSGKSTLLRCINGLIPHSSGGTVAGRVLVGGRDAAHPTTRDAFALGPQGMAATAGLVIQAPEASFVADRVEDEVAFALENAGLPPAEMAARIAAALAETGSVHLRERSLATLSGGEQQRIALAAALALRPPVLLLDEPLSQLDPQGAADVVERLRALHVAGRTIIVAEHRLERLLPYATHVITLTEDGTARELSPDEVRLHEYPPPDFSRGPREPRLSRTPRLRRTPHLRCVEVTVKRGERAVVQDFSCEVGRGELVALVGPNGVGKTTLLQACVGLLPLWAGRIELDGEDIGAWETARRCRRIGYLPQAPDLLLFAETVREELRITLRNHGLPENGAVANLLARLGLAAAAAAYPRDLSVGERQRVALGAIAVTRPAVLLLDEPTRGLDAPRKAALGRLLRAWCAEGMSVLLVTHDVAWAEAFAERVVRMGEDRDRERR